MLRPTPQALFLFLGVLTLAGPAGCGGATGDTSQRDAVPAKGAPEADLSPITIPPEAILHRVDGAAPGDWFGYSVAALGDVNADGVPDFAVGAHQNENWGHRPAPNAEPGYINVYSGATGERLYQLLSEGSKNIDGSDDHFGWTMTSIQDQDGDGVREILAGAYLYDADDGIDATVDENTGGAFIYSGKTGALLKVMGGVLWGDRFGYAVSGFEDMNGDGREDLLIGVEKTDGAHENEGSLQVFAMATFERLVTALGPGLESHLGCSVARVGDVNGDGVPDLAGGAFMYSGEGDAQKEIGWAGVYSGKSGEPLHTWSGERMDHLGYMIAGLGDTDGDGVSELAVGANQSGWIADYTGPGYLRVYSCGSGELLYELRGEEQGDQFSWGLAAATDHDGDGVKDLLVGAPASISVSRDETTGRPGKVYLFSGRDGAPLGACHGLETDDQFGCGVADIGDVNGDGVADFLIGAPSNVPDQSKPGYAVVVSGAFLARGVK